MKIVLIGSGNVATQFGLAFQQSGHRIIQVYSRTTGNARRLARKLKCEYTIDQNKISFETDLFFVAFSDSATADFTGTFNPKEKLIVHTSGSLPLSVFNSKVKNCGVLYPMKSFTKAQKTDMQEVTFFVEGNSKIAEKKVLAIAKQFSENVHSVTSRQRFVIHLAAVFANNFPNHLLAISELLLKSEQLSLRLFYPMIEQTFSKIRQFSPAELQTGPAKRGDKKTIDAHLRYLTGFPEFKEIYKLLSSSIEKKYRK